MRPRTRSIITRRRTAVAVALAGIVLLGSYFRLTALAEESLWLDEAVSWRMATAPLPEVIPHASADNHPPLYFLLLKAWTGAFGDSVFAMRCLSALVGCTLPLAAYLFTARLLAEPSARPSPGAAPHRRGLTFIALLAAALCGLSGYQIVHDREARMYALAAVLSLVSSWFLIGALRSGPATLRGWSGYVLSAAALTYTHYYGLFLIAGHVIYSTGNLLQRHRGIVRRLVALRPASAAFVIVGLLFLPWLPALLAQQAQVRADFWLPPVDRAAILGLLEQFFTTNRELNRAVLGPWVAIFLGAVILATLLRPRPGGYFLVTAAVTPFSLGLIVSLASGRSILHAKYLLVCFPFFFIMLARLALWLPSPSARVAFALAGLTPVVLQDYEHLHGIMTRPAPGLRAAAKLIRDRVGEGDLVVTAKASEYFALQYYLRPNAHPYLLTKDKTGLVHYAGGSLLHAEHHLCRNELPVLRPSRIWLVYIKAGDYLPAEVLERYEEDGVWSFQERAPFRGSVVYLSRYKARREAEPVTTSTRK